MFFDDDKHTFTIDGSRGFMNPEKPGDNQSFDHFANQGSVGVALVIEKAQMTPAYRGGQRYLFHFPEGNKSGVGLGDSVSAYRLCSGTGWKNEYFGWLGWYGVAAVYDYANGTHEGEQYDQKLRYTWTR